MVKEMIRGAVNTAHPLRGGGMVESLVILAVVVFVLYANVKGIELTPQVMNLFSMVLVWLGWKMKENSNVEGDTDNE